VRLVGYLIINILSVSVENCEVQVHMLLLPGPY